VSVLALPTHVATTTAALPYLLTVGRTLTIAITAYYAAKAVVFLLAATVAVCTKNTARRRVCLEIVRIVCRGWPWPPRLPGP